MKVWESITMALGSLLVNRLRALLTMLGIIIGVGAVIGLISLGRGVEDFIASEFEDLGTNIVVVFSSAPSSPTRERIQPMSTNEVEDILALPSVAAVAPIHGLNGNIVNGRENFPNVLSYGVTPSFIEVRNYAPLYGRFISNDDLTRRTRVLVLGYGVAEELFGEDFADPTGSVVRYQDIVFEVVGVMEKTSDVAGENDYIYMPITTSQQRLAPPTRSRTRDGGYWVDAVYLQAVDEDSISLARQEVFDYLTVAHDIQFVGEEDFTVVAQSDVLESLNDITGRLTIFLSLIASTSLVVGGIGIMNIMLVTVTERTKEIGLRKALGARRIDILLQFLVESIVLSTLGGALGITFGWLVAVLGTALVSQLTLGVQTDAVILATSVSIAVGLFFGLYPAYQASVKNPIDALRFE